MTAMQATFSHIYRTNLWGNPESRSGPGSTVERTRPVREALLAFVRELGVATLLDAPCGDFNWMKETRLPLRRYIGVDVVPEIINENRRSYAASDRSFHALDITCDALPRADLVICRDCLVHLSFADAWRAIRNFQGSGAVYLVTTTFTRRQHNSDITTGQWRPINLREAPFGFPAPLDSKSDGCPHPEYTDKELALWRLRELPAEQPIPAPAPAGPGEPAVTPGAGA